MERVTGSKGLAVAALVSLIIHGGILLTYAFVFKGVGTSTSYEPLKVALVLPSELEKPAAPPLKLVKKEKQGDAPAPADLIKERGEATPKAATPAAKAEGEATAAAAPQAKDLETREFNQASLKEQNPRPGPENEAAFSSGGTAASLPSAGPTTGKVMGSGINSPGFTRVAASGGEVSLAGYAQLTTFKGASLTSAAPRYTENSLPAYPLPARRRGYAGVVLLSVEVLADGRVGHLELKKTSGYDLLDKSAQETVKSWKFSPGKKMGTPITMWVDVPVRFELN